MTDFIQVQWTSESIDEARAITRILVEKKLIACVNILSCVESIYEWAGKVEVKREVKAFMTTRGELFNEIKKLIESKSAYEVPAIVALPILDGKKSYLEFIKNSSGFQA